MGADYYVGMAGIKMLAVGGLVWELVAFGAATPIPQSTWAPLQIEMEGDYSVEIQSLGSALPVAVSGLSNLP